MSHELFKKHRPRSLARVAGNEDSIRTLENMLARGTLPHFLLFCGPSGCGKTTLARIVKNRLGCQSLDFRELNCSDFRGIDTIREISRSMNLAPTGGPCRVWLLDEVHQLSKDAQNAALKILEDTPGHVYFLFCTTDPEKLIKTLLNRACHIFVTPLSDEELTKLVNRVARREKIQLEKNELEELVDVAAGSPRRVLVLLDKIKNLDPEQRTEKIKDILAEKAQAIELCRLLLNPNKKQWRGISNILKKLEGNPEQVRYAVLSYARKVLLDKGTSQAYIVIKAFEDNFYDSKEAGLARACFETVFDN